MMIYNDGDDDDDVKIRNNRRENVLVTWRKWGLEG